MVNNKPERTLKDLDLAQLFRAESGRILAILVSECRAIQLAEDALQDACIQATQQWPTEPPRNQVAWLLKASRRRMIDRLRTASRQRHLNALHIDSSEQSETELECEQEIPDERLKLIFTCCHPSLNQNAQVALTLKAVCGLSTLEIARAYLSSETAMQQRLVRAKNKIRSTGIAYKVPEGEDLAARLESVLTTIYLIFNESYSAYSGQSLTREDLGDEAIRLAKVLYRLLPEPEVGGLLALMLLHQSRRSSRSSEHDGFVPLQYQDRTNWDQEKISLGRRILLDCLSQNRAGKYQLQAAISALHAEALNWDETDWQQIQLLYAELYKQMPSPIVKLNGILAMAHQGKVAKAMEYLKPIATELDNYQPFYAAKADLHTKLGQNQEAKQCYQRAIAMSRNDIEQAFLESKLKKIR